MIWLGGALYFLAGGGMLAYLRRPSSALQWNEPPTFVRQAAVLLCWPAVVLAAIDSELEGERQNHHPDF